MIAAIVGFVEGTFDPTVTGTVEVIREVKALASKPPLQITSV
jgi:phosphopantetheine adenylyltransferase